MKTLWLVLLAPALALAAPVKVPADPTEGLGMNIHFTDPRPGELEMMEAAGVRWVRMDFTWDGTEREVGKYDFSAYDRLLAALEKHRMRAIFILDYGNHHYEPAGAVRTPEGREAFARWAAAALTHFKGHGIYWEIWNEPNGGFWKPKANVEEYAAMALAASKAMREAAPEETIIGPATSTIDMTFLEACGKAGLYQYWDAVSVHPYRQKGPETAAVEYTRLRRRVAKFRPLPIISGEWGYSSAWANFDAEKQGKMLPREWLTNIANGIPVSIWYDWHEDGKDPKESEHHFGTVGYDYHAGADPVYEPKPAYLAAQKLTAELRDCAFMRRLAVGGAEDYVLLFQHGEGLKLAAWTTASVTHTVALPSESGVSLALTDTPQYLDLPMGDGKMSALPGRPPLQAAVEPGGGGIRVQVDYAGTDALSAQVKLTEVKNEEQPLTLAADEEGKTVHFTMDKLPETFRAGAQIVQGASVLLEVPARQFSRAKPELLTGATVRVDGDPKVASEQKLTVGAPREPLAGDDGPTLRLDYQMSAGWKFLQVVPSGGSVREIPGRPTAFGLWIYGDGQACFPRLRVTDAGGRTWQPSGPWIDWKGWRYVEMPLNAETGHWGGSKEGSIIAYPLRWDTIFLLDAPKEKEHAGSVYFTPPWLIE